jgi:hypothetical protein
MAIFSPCRSRASLPRAATMGAGWRQKGAVMLAPEEIEHARIVSRDGLADEFEIDDQLGEGLAAGVDHTGSQAIRLTRLRL